MAGHICPVWVGYLMVSPLRKIHQNPVKILKPYIDPGMKVLDVGSAMGFFSIPMAAMVGAKGKVICVDVQERMLEKLIKRAKKAGVDDRIEIRLCSANSLNVDDLRDELDFVLAFAVAHEVSDISAFFVDVYQTLKPEGKLLFSEPTGHVSEHEFQNSTDIAVGKGFRSLAKLKISRMRSVILIK